MRRFLKDRRGVSAVEFALVFPVLALMQLGGVVIFQMQTQQQATAFIARAAAFAGAQAVAKSTDPQAAAQSAFNANQSQFIFGASATLGAVNCTTTLCTVSVSSTAPAVVPIIGFTTIAFTVSATD